MTATWSPTSRFQDRYRLGSKEICLGASAENGVELLPAALRDLLVRSDNLYRRIARLDDVLFGEGAGRRARRARRSIDALEQAFGARLTQLKRQSK